ncbi:uncharacterized protein BX663DRAFT_504040, partial [Cokeromyces recurvatus]|uniref:uncharacterized protein n=1 Tax=Cokeromyces recurvatus TaxID=90255 RepID=UPI00221F6D74
MIVYYKTKKSILLFYACKFIKMRIICCYYRSLFCLPDLLYAEYYRINNLSFAGLSVYIWFIFEMRP